MPARTDPLLAATALSLADAGYTGAEIERRTGLNKNTAYGILNGCGSWGKIAEQPIFKKFRAEQNLHLESTARALAARFFIHAEENIEKMQPYQAVVAGSILIDKAQILAGLPTEITANLHIHQFEQLESLSTKLKQLKNGEGNSGGNSIPPIDIIP